MRLPHVAVVFNWRHETNKSGLYCVHLRIKFGTQARYYRIQVPRKIKKTEWLGEEDNWIHPRHEFAFEINNKIREKKNLILDLIKRSYTYNKNLSFNAIFLQLNRKGDINSFYDYMENYMRKPPEKLAENTLKKYATCLRHLKSFQKQLVFSDIDNHFVQDFRRYMERELNLQGAACKKYMDAFKRVVHQARKENYMDAVQMEFLFDGLKIKVPKAKRTFLEPQEIRNWKEFVFDADQKHLERDRDMFLFQIYTGYYYKDLFIFTKDQLIDDEQFGYLIRGARDKNGNETIIPLFKFPHAGKIISRYGSALKDKTVFDLIHLVEEPVFNRNLKEIAKLVGIPKNISNKVARHTNAQLWMRYGAERPVLSKMMGHRKEETTKNYYEINLIEVVEGTKKADFGRLNI